MSQEDPNFKSELSYELTGRPMQINLSDSF